MYQALLTRRYLTTKVMPLLAILAVMLCTAMVLVVWSIMGGFLTMLLSSGRTLMGDVAVLWPDSGFPHYERFIELLEADPQVAAATPVVESGAAISLPDGRIKWVFIKGIHGPSYGEVTGYADALWWKPLDAPLPRDTRGKDSLRLTSGESFHGRILDQTESSVRFRIEPFEGPPSTREFPRSQVERLLPGEYQDLRLDSPRRDPARWTRMFQEGIDLKEYDPVSGDPRSAIVIGIEVTGFNKRLESGVYVPMAFHVRTDSGTTEIRRDFIPDSSLLVTVYPQGRSGRPADVVSRILPVANEFRTGIFEIDSGTAFIELGELQRMLKMDEAVRLAGGDAAPDPYRIVIDPQTGEERFETAAPVRTDPARITTVLIRAADGITPDQLAPVVERIYRDFAAEFPDEVPSPPPLEGDAGPDSIIIQTWEQRQGTMVQAVKKEIALVMGILIFISMVASFLILAIFWAMVSEKTKDIGVLRALGAGKIGVAGLWLGYGVAIGLIGSLLGAGVAHLIVWNVNPIHEWLGRAFDLYVWDPEVYYFTEIPNVVEGWKALTVVIGGLVFSILGALIPAIKAANMDPVRALRFE